MKQSNKSIYIQSLEGADISNHIVRGNYIKHDYVGMIPFSLELMQLQKEGLEVFESKRNPHKQLSNDVINVKFNKKVRSAEEIIENLTKKANEIKDDKDEYKIKLKSAIEDIKKSSKEDSTKWAEIKVNALRQELYTNGFTLTHCDYETGEIISKTEYVVYKRSSAKSRTGQCLFIKKELHDSMIQWSRMNLDFKPNMEIDYPSLLAYESLVGSSLEGTVKIKPNNILMVTDIESTFTISANVVKTGDDGFLDSFEEDVEISNSIFDGQSLLSAEYFTKGKSMMLLRNHFFKSCAFNTNIQQFLMDNCPADVKFEDWKVKDMFGNSIKAKDIHMITTPSSLKALKFSSIVGGEKEMWSYWKKLIKAEGCIFGVCKNEKSSKLQDKQQTSYQILNSLPMSYDDMAELSIFEQEYVKQLKNNDEVFIQHAIKEATNQNANMMFTELYKVNPKITQVAMFKDFRRRLVKDHVKHVKHGKIRLKGDYCVMVGNPLEMLKHAIGKYDETKLALTGNQVYTKLHKFGKEIAGFRNPHTSASNVLVAENTYNEDIEKYFNLTKNIAVMNAVGFPLLDILSGSDYDSDTILLLDDSKLTNICKQCFGHEKVCINKVKSTKKDYNLNNHDMYIIDNELSKSQQFIGRVVNVGQLCLSKYWDEKANGGTDLTYLKKNVDVMTVLSGIAIDMAKKKVDILMDAEIRNVERTSELGKSRPNFWIHVSQSNNIKEKVTKFECPMDFLDEIMSKTPRAKATENISLSKLLVEVDARKGNRKQKTHVIELVAEMQSEILSVNAKYDGKETDDEQSEKYNVLDDVVTEYIGKVSKLKIKAETMYDILSKIEKNNSDIVTRLMNALYLTNQEVFLGAFKSEKNA